MTTENTTPVLSEENKQKALNSLKAALSSEKYLPVLLDENTSVLDRVWAWRYISASAEIALGVMSGVVKPMILGNEQEAAFILSRDYEGFDLLDAILSLLSFEDPEAVQEKVNEIAREAQANKEKFNGE